MYMCIMRLRDMSCCIVVIVKLCASACHELVEGQEILSCPVPFCSVTTWLLFYKSLRACLE
jgi:hypothetical protein